MALRDYTLRNFMIWSMGGLLVAASAGIGAAQWLRPSAPEATLAEAPPPEAAPVATAPIPREPTPVLASPAELPRLHPPAPRARLASKIPVPPRPAPLPARARVPVPNIAPPPTYAPAAQWRQTYVVTPYRVPYYAYVPRYRDYAAYPGY